MKKIVLCLVFIALSSSASESDITSIVKKYDLPALAGAKVVVGGKDIVVTYGTRKYKGKVFVTSKDKFHLGSNGKSMTATLIGVLVQKKLLQWDTKIKDIFPDLELNSGYKNLTVEMLLAHRGGTPGDLIKFQGGALWSSLWNPKLPTEEGRRLVLTKVLKADPEEKIGSKYIYSNAGYIILGAIIDKVSTMRWEDFIQKELFLPLEMNSCGFGAPGNPDLKLADQPWMHKTVNNKPSPKKPDFFADNPAATAPAGGVHCSLNDWGKYLKAHMNGYNKKSNFLKNEIFKKLHTAYPGQTYTYGAWIKLQQNWAKGDTFHHAGSNTMSRSVVWMAPKINHAYTAATNYGSKEAYTAMDELIGLLMSH